VRCFGIKTAIYCAFRDYRTNRLLNGGTLRNFRCFAPAILVAYLVLQFSIEFHYQRFLLEDDLLKRLPKERLSDHWVARSYSLLEKKKTFSGCLAYGISLALSIFEPIRR